MSILPTLLGKRQSFDRTLFWVRREGGQLYQGQDYYAVRRGPWKLLQNTPFENYQLFNLDDDPLELIDVSDGHRSIVKDLTEKLRHHVQVAAKVPWQQPMATDDDQE
jgi:arylsulfatase A-like enzyme